MTGKLTSRAKGNNSTQSLQGHNKEKLLYTYKTPCNSYPYTFDLAFNMTILFFFSI